MNRTIGIDPGVTGGIALLLDGDLLAVDPLPVRARLHGSGQQIDGAALMGWLMHHRQGQPCMVFSWRPWQADQVRECGLCSILGIPWASSRACYRLSECPTALLILLAGKKRQVWPAKINRQADHWPGSCTQIMPTDSSVLKTMAWLRLR